MSSVAESFYLHSYFKLAELQPLTIILTVTFPSQSDQSHGSDFRQQILITYNKKSAVIDKYINKEEKRKINK